MKKILICLTVIVLLLSGCGTTNQKTEKINGTQINLSDNKITVDGEEISNDSTQAVYSANDIVFYLAGQDFTYGEGEKQDEHEQSEADAHTVVHITKAGRYVLSGKLSLGQIAVDLGEDAETNPDAVVTLILNGVDITCEVAPAVIFYNVYECSEADEESAKKDVDTKKAGANVVIADGSENNINGSYVAKIYKSYELSEDGKEVIDSKKLHKYDGAFYSKKSININGGDKGNGILNINAENEGLDSELHLTINGGVINITSGNDGINTNEDNVSVTTVNGGTVNILCDGSTGEGDGIDSNGWLVINGGKVVSQACATSGDAGIDSDKGIYINGGEVVATGNMLDRIAGGNQTYAVFSFTNRQKANSVYKLKKRIGITVNKYELKNAFTYLIIANDKLTPGDYTFWQDDTKLAGSAANNMQGGMPMGEMPDGDFMQGGRPDFSNGERPEMPDDFSMPEGEMHDGDFTQGGRPDFSNGERPEMPDDFSMPEGEMPDGDFTQGGRPDFSNGERPEMPEGMTPPNMGGGMFGGNKTQSGETSTIFTITEGANQFSNVGPSK